MTALTHRVVFSLCVLMGMLIGMIPAVPAQEGLPSSPGGSASEAAVGQAEAVAIDQPCPTCSPCCPQGCPGHQGCLARYMASVGGFNCSCRGSYKFPVPPQYTYHWPGLYSQQLMTAYQSPYRYPALRLPPWMEGRTNAGLQQNGTLTPLMPSPAEKANENKPAGQ